MARGWTRTDNLSPGPRASEPSTPDSRVTYHTPYVSRGYLSSVGSP